MMFFFQFWEDQLFTMWIEYKTGNYQVMDVILGIIMGDWLSC
jgi:hypothetical protein